MRVLGPGPAPIARVRGMHRWQLALKATERKTLRPAVAAIVALGSAAGRSGGARGARVRVVLDVDPVSLL